MLSTVINGVSGNQDLEEAAVTAVELLRFGLFHSDRNMFPSYNGAPMRGSSKFTTLDSRDNILANAYLDTDKNINLLVSRVAGLGTLHHRPIGFTGPLSQHLLGYNSIINAIRSALRDLVEVSATQIFMAAFAKRDIDNISSISTK